MATARGTAGSYYSLAEIGYSGDTGLVTGVGGKCVDVFQRQFRQRQPASSSGPATATPISSWTQSEDGTIRTLGKCMDARSTAILTPVVLWTCDGSAGQKWMPRADGTLLNVRAPAAASTPSGALSTNGTKLIIYTCHTASNQKWVLP